MNDSLRLGSVRGIRIGVHWSVLVIGWLLAWSLASRILPAAAPGATGAAYWAAGIGVALLFFGSLLAHELAHAVLARRAGVRVEGITLWLLGGVARLDGEAPTPGHELRIAAAGPAASALLGIGFGVAGMVLGYAGAPALVREAAGYLAGVNLILAAFNLLPGAPLDGGRIVRAVAWRLGRDRLSASLLAARLGRVLGYGMIAFGLFDLLVGADLGGLWTIVLGLFLTNVASAEASQETARAALSGVRVREAMTTDLPRVPGGITIDVFTEGVLVAQGRSVALVTETGGEPVAVAGLGEVKALRRGAWRDARVRDIAIPLTDLPQIDVDELLLPALERVGTGASPGGYLLVTHQERSVGLVTPDGLARFTATRSLRARDAGTRVGGDASTDRRSAPGRPTS